MSHFRNPFTISGAYASFRSFECCLSDAAAQLYIFFNVMNCVLLVYHFVLLIFWPGIWDRLEKGAQAYRE